ncbi:hypothetical protein VIGAN_08128600 [Vigna angularis var. angularis]|uniref:Transcription factor CBF/NF-Y/archaeal histone domain-containing protein n=1 Tax=Vigna angularis var. angularis TaxID=157739 RepID=A0A0S3SPE3_PHAAN|nr:hypothetical protein VIGAN_08128600 [Vigna angularis var. angularis]
MSDVPVSPSHDSGGEQSPRASSSGAREQDRLLPIANISRIMKKGLSPNGKIAKDAKDTMQECVSEFISFITSEASEKCQKEKRKTINGDDLLWAMATLGFEDYIEPLKVYLARYREVFFFSFLFFLDKVSQDSYILVCSVCSFYSNKLFVHIYIYIYIYKSSVIVVLFFSGYTNRTLGYIYIPTPTPTHTIKT